MAMISVRCPHCNSDLVSKRGTTSNGKQRYACKNDDCSCKSFILDYTYNGKIPEVKDKIIDMTLNGSGIRDTARVLSISTATVILDLKKTEFSLQSVNRTLLETLNPDDITVEFVRVEEAYLSEMWSFVGKKEEQRWLWHAIDHNTGAVLAYILGEHKDKVFLQLKELLEPFGIQRYYTDDWGSYERHLEAEKHVVGKRNTQKIERKHLTLRTRIKRLVRKTICFSKTIQMHDIVIGLFINRYEFGVPI